VEAGVSSGWEKIIGDAGRSVGVERYGASADYQTLYHQFGITADAVAAAARDSIHDAQHGTRPGGHPATFAPAAGGTADRPACSRRPEHDH
jgi:transketolase